MMVCMSKSRSPNFIICMADQLRWSEIGCYGNDVVRTPNIDKLAQRGLKFETAVTPRPVCMAARSALLTSQFPRQCTGGVGNFVVGGNGDPVFMPEYPISGRTHLKDTTLPESLKAAGYHTAAIGKWHMNVWPDVIGFDEYVIPRVHHCHSGQLYTRNGSVEFAPDNWSVDFECDEVAAHLQQRTKSDEPFFLYYNISPPHCPVTDAPEKYLSMYDKADIPIRPNVDLSTPLPDQEHWFKVYRWDFRYYMHHLPETEHLPDDYDLQQLIAEYYGMTTWVDDAVGRLVQSLEAADLLDDTIVVFTADHGDNLGSHGLVQKGTTNDESIRVPHIVSGGSNTGVVTGQVNSSQVASLLDLMPSFIDLANADVPDTMSGQSLASVWQGDASHTDRPHAFVETGSQGVAIRTPTHQVALPDAQGRKVRHGNCPATFFDMQHDPYQLNNLAGSGEQADIEKELRNRLTHWHATTPTAEPAA